MNILVVENMFETKNNLAKIIEKSYPDIRVYVADSMKSALKIIQAKEVGIFFIDTVLCDGSGLVLARQIRHNKNHKLTPIIFISNEIIQILEAFKTVHCYDYLVKPYNKADIEDIIDLFFNKQEECSIKEGEFSYFDLKGNVTVKIYYDEIIFIEYIARNCIIHTTKGEYQLKGAALSKLVNDMQCNFIIQSHKSYAVNIRFIERIEKVYAKLWNVYFRNYEKVAQLSYKYKYDIKVG